MGCCGSKKIRKSSGVNTKSATTSKKEKKKEKKRISKIINGKEYFFDV